VLAEQFSFFLKQCLWNVFQRRQQSIFQELVEQCCFFSDACRFFSVAKVKQYNFFTSLIFFSAGPAEHFSVVLVRAVWLFQWRLLISSPVWFFFFSSASTAVSEAPAEHFSAAPLEQPNSFSGTHSFFSVAHVKQYNFFSGTSGAVWFAFSLAPMEHVSVVPAEHFLQWSGAVRF